MTRTFSPRLIAPVRGCGCGARRVARLRCRLGARAARALGARRSSRFHLWQLDRLARWAEGPLDAPVPEGRGSWRQRVLRRSIGACARASPSSATSRTRSSASPRAAEAIPEGMVVLDDGEPHPLGQRARACAPRARPRARRWASRSRNLVRQPEVIRYLEIGDFSDAVVVDSQREPGVTLSIQVVPFGVEQKLLLSRDITQLEAVARMRRDFIANVSHELKTPLTVVTGFLETLQDLELDPRQRTRYLAADARAGAQHAAAGRRPADAVGARKRAEPAAPTRVRRSCRCCSRSARDAKALSAGRHTIVALDLRRRRRWSPAIATSSRARSATSCSNAVRYTPDGGTITLVVARRRRRPRRRSASPTPASASRPSTSRG